MGYTKIFATIVIFVSLGFLFPLFFLYNYNFYFTFNLFLAWLIIVYCAIRLSFLSFLNQQRMLELTFWIFTYTWMGITPFLQVLTGKFPWNIRHTNNDVTTALIITLIGLFAYEIGRFTYKGKQSEESKSGKFYFRKPFYLITFLSLLLSVFIIQRNGGFASLFLSRIEVETVYQSKIALLINSNLSKVPLFVSLVIGLTMFKQFKVKNIVFLIVLFLLIITNIVISNPISNPRYWFGTVFLTICFIVFKWRKNSFLFWVVTTLSILLIIFPYADIFRYSTNDKINTVSIAEQLSLNGDYDAFQQLSNTVVYVREQGVVYGNQLLGALLFWVPRSIWISKPNGTGQIVGEYLGYGFTNLSSPLWAEGYINFGFIGVFFFFALYGFLTKKLQLMYINAKKRESFSFVLIFTPFLAAYQLFLLRGDLLNGIAYMSAYMLFSFIYGKLSKKQFNEHLEEN